MRHSIAKKGRVVTIYINKNLHFMKHRFCLLKQFAAEKDIQSSEKSMRRIVKRWLETGN